MVRSKSFQGIPENLQPSDSKRQLQPMPSTLGEHNTSQKASETKSTTKTFVPSSSPFQLIATMQALISLCGAPLSSTIELKPQLCQSVGGSYSSIALLYPSDGYQTQKILQRDLILFQFFIIFNFVYLYMCVGYVHVSTSTCTGQRCRPPGAGDAGSCGPPNMVLGIKPISTRRAVHASYP